MTCTHKFLIILVALFAICTANANAQTLLEKRDGFEITIVDTVKETEKLPTPPQDHPFELVQYDTGLGKMAAYLTKPYDEPENTKYPAIIWITGGHPQGGASPEFAQGGGYKNNQTADSFFKRGVITLYPTFRGTFGNPGVREEFYGEVNDVLAALKFLQQQSHIDSDHIYLGGHSTGATLALLAAASTDEFAGVISLGPQDDVKNHGSTRLFDTNNPKEFELRAPINHLDLIKTPTFVIEGEFGVSDALGRMSERSNNSVLSFWEISGANHFDVIQASNDLFAEAIVQAIQEPSKKFAFSRKRLESAYTELAQNMMRAEALQSLAQTSAKGIDITKQHELTHYFYSQYQGPIDAITKALKEAKFTKLKSEKVTNEAGEEFITLEAVRKQKPADLDQLFKDRAIIERLDREWNFTYRDWYIESGK